MYVWTHAVSFLFASPRVLPTFLLLSCYHYKLFFFVEFQSVAGVSAAASVDAPGETTSLSRTKPTGTVPGTRPCPRTTDRLTRTVPGIYTHPHSGEFFLYYSLNSHFISNSYSTLLTKLYLLRACQNFDKFHIIVGTVI